jgi:glutathione S-transferase
MLTSINSATLLSESRHAPHRKCESAILWICINRMFDVISEQLGDRTWLLGDRFSAADLFLFMLIRWGRGMPRPPRSISNLNTLAERVLARPAVQEALQAEGIKAPVF